MFATSRIFHGLLTQAVAKENRQQGLGYPPIPAPVRNGWQVELPAVTDGLVQWGPYHVWALCGLHVARGSMGRWMVSCDPARVVKFIMEV